MITVWCIVKVFATIRNICKLSCREASLTSQPEQQLELEPQEIGVLLHLLLLDLQHQLSDPPQPQPLPLNNLLWNRWTPWLTTTMTLDCPGTYIMAKPCSRSYHLLHTLYIWPGTSFLSFARRQNWLQRRPRERRRREVKVWSKLSREKRFRDEHQTCWAGRVEYLMIKWLSNSFLGPVSMWR